jgi:hypothetical protein
MLQPSSLPANHVQVSVLFRHGQFFVRENGHVYPASVDEINRRFGPHFAEAVTTMERTWIIFDDDPRAEAAACPFIPGDWVSISDPTGSYACAEGRFIRVEPNGQYCVLVDRGHTQWGGCPSVNLREETYPAARVTRWENTSTRIAKHNIDAMDGLINVLA